MAHFAKLDENNVVTDVFVVSNDDIKNLPFPQSEGEGILFLKNWSNGHTKWKQTSYNNNFRKRYAGVGYTYNQQYDAFIPPKPYPSWVFDENELLYMPPVPYPIQPDQQSDVEYIWNEDIQNWDILNLEGN